MNTFKMTIPALALVFLFTAGPLWAQGFSRYPTNPANRPAVSPYINLIRGGSTAGVNYYGLVRPEVDFRNAIQQNQQQIAANQQSISDIVVGPTATGHPARYMTHWGYFLNSGSGPGTANYRLQPTPVAPKPPTLPQLPQANPQTYGGGIRR